MFYYTKEMKVDNKVIKINNLSRLVKFIFFLGVVN